VYVDNDADFFGSRKTALRGDTGICYIFEVFYNSLFSAMDTK
jgi:hypothetical protein